MKNLILSLAVVLMAGVPMAAHADGPSAKSAYRYHIRYDQWDAGFHGYYGYRESGCNRAGYNTCYDPNLYAPDTQVYAEQWQLNDGRERVRVYTDSSYSTPYVEYYVYDDGTTREIEGRQFYTDTYYPNGVVVIDQTTYTRDLVIWNAPLWDQGSWDKLIGAVSIDLGVAIMAGSDSSTGLAVGGALAIAGSISMSVGQHDQDMSGLETVIVKKQYTVVDVR
jgi:hypothetical protein